MLEDLLRPGLDVVFVGTAASTESARQKVYYAHPQNKFWPTLKRIGLIPDAFERRDFACLLDFGIGLTDLCKTRAGMDRTLRRGDFDVDGLRTKLLSAAPRCIALTSRRAASVFLAQPSSGLRLGVPLYISAQLPPLFVLPSPSGAASGHWSIEPWQALAAFIGARQVGTHR